VSSYYSNPPIVKYENISFHSIPPSKSIGLLTIKSNAQITSFSKNIGSIKAGSIYNRVGSKSEPLLNEVKTYAENKSIVEGIYNYSKNSIKSLLDSTFEFFKLWDKAYKPQYIVFKEQFVLCWSGYYEEPFHSEVDVQLINEGIRLFFSAVIDVQITYTDDEFCIKEFQNLGYENNYEHHPTKLTTIKFNQEGKKK